MELRQPGEVQKLIDALLAILPDVPCQHLGVVGTVRALHRKVGPRHVYMVMDATPGSVVEFRTKGAAELWDPWTGKARPLRRLKETATGTQVELPLETYEAQIVVFTPGQKQVNPQSPDTRPLLQKTLTQEFHIWF